MNELLIDGMAVINQWVLASNCFMLAKNFVDGCQMRWFLSIMTMSTTLVHLDVYTFFVQSAVFRYWINKVQFAKVS